MVRKKTSTKPGLTEAHFLNPPTCTNPAPEFPWHPPVALGKGLVGAGVAVAEAGGPLGRMVAAGGVVLVATV